jgi:hypothetical protein
MLGRVRVCGRRPVANDWQNVMNDDSNELSDLWARRTSLSEAEWTRLYRLCIALLEARPDAMEAQLVPARDHAARRALRDSFFVDKVLMPAHSPGRVMGSELKPWALLGFYANWLRDQLRARGRNPETGEEPDAERTADEATEIPGAERADCTIEAPERVDGAALRVSARTFVQRLEDWAVLYLALHFCHGRERLPLSRLHTMYAIPSYHYKARQLGIAPPRGGFGDSSDFADTLLGEWLTGSGIALEAEALDAIRFAFDLLCLEAFAEHDRRDPSPVEGAS